MKLLLAGWLTVGLALLWDRFLHLLKVKEGCRVGVIVPISEELFKFGVSYFYKLDPILLYALFGCGEGIYESIHYKKRFDFVLILMGVLAHTFFSISFVFQIPVWLSLSLAMITHVIWNQTILKQTADRN